MSLTNGEFKANLEGFFGNLKDILKENVAAKQEIAELRSRAARQAEAHESQRQHRLIEHMQQVAELEASKQKLVAALALTPLGLAVMAELRLQGLLGSGSNPPSAAQPADPPSTPTDSTSNSKNRKDPMKTTCYHPPLLGGNRFLVRRLASWG